MANCPTSFDMITAIAEITLEAFLFNSLPTFRVLQLRFSFTYVTSVEVKFVFLAFLEETSPNMHMIAT